MKHQRVKDPALKEMPAYVDDFIIKKARFQADSELDNLLKHRDPTAVVCVTSCSFELHFHSSHCRSNSVLDSSSRS